MMVEATPATVVRAQPDWVGRAVGLATFAVGIVLLVLLFFYARSLILTPEKAPTKIDAAYYANRSFAVVVHLVVLGLMGFFASAIAGRGAQMYAASNRAPVITD